MTSYRDRRPHAVARMTGIFRPKEEGAVRSRRAIYQEEGMCMYKQVDPRAVHAGTSIRSDPIYRALHKGSGRPDTVLLLGRMWCL